MTLSGEIDGFVPYEDCVETDFHLPETWIGYNATDDVVKIKKFTTAGDMFERAIEDPDVADNVVAKWLKIRKWQKVLK